ncbi:metal-dependent transcriptional regulator [Halostella sp. PRR32]|uniref:metal-dependent transcriptional regulator n=1 Tax=Halostella sp. PRR32 TaxID=3098147 RepID=UPI002B1DBF9F|nr:metal-dependent transcriptional regulator [Halostella sp. PRR32]
MLSDVMEDYLKAIYYLERDEGAPIGTSRLAEYLDVTAPTVTSMVDSLEERGLVDREKYKGVELTTDGETVAVEVVRHHRLLEAYLTEHLDYDWTEVHDEADALEHHISEEFERRVANALGDPEVDPHGDPIPSPDLTPPDEGTGTRLDEHGENERLKVERVSDRDADELAYLQDAGVVPGTVLEITDVAPFGMVTVDVDGDEQSLPESVARSIRVSVATDSDESVVEEA